MINEEPIIVRYLNKSGNTSIIWINPNPIKHNSSVKPIVAPDTKEIVLLNPLFKPEEIMIMLTGPGLIDITKENTTIANNADILTPYIRVIFKLYI